MVLEGHPMVLQEAHIQFLSIQSLRYQSLS
jgi:hypothetical protein